MSEKRKPLLGFMGKLPSGPALGNSGKTHCPSCMGLFQAPRLLPCLHTVCTTCLEQLEPFSVVDIRGGDSDTSSEGSLFQELKPPCLQPQTGILCPVCDAQVDLPMGGVKALTIDHLAMNDVMLESLRGEGQGLVCDLCSDRDLEKRCQTCKANLCHFCCQAHRRQKKTTYHTMVDLKDLKGYSRIGKAILCPAHPAEELRLFCELCDQPVCRDCVVGAHREHPCDFTSNVIHKHGDSVRELLRDTQPRVQALEEALARVKDTNSALQQRVEAVAADIRTFSEGYIKAVEEHRDRLLKQLEDLRLQQESSLQLQKAQLEQLLADLRTGVEFTEHLLTSGTDLEILITKGVVVERLTKLNQVEYSARPRVNDKICFSPQEKAGRCRGYEVYGAINTKEVDPAQCVLQGKDLHRARERQTASFTLLCKDAAGESMGRGGDNIQVAVVPKDKKDSPVRTMVQDNKDGTYGVSYTPKEPGIYKVLVCVKEQHVQLACWNSEFGKDALITGDNLLADKNTHPRNIIRLRVFQLCSDDDQMVDLLEYDWETYTLSFQLPSHLSAAHGSPFTVTVRKRHHPHPGVFHCCTFCSSGGQKTARCACGGTMPGGYLGCGHGHKGHPGRPHWSCCGKFTEKSECTWTGGQSTARSLLRTVAL